MQHVLAVPSPTGMDWSSALAPADLLSRLGMAELGQAWNKTPAPRGFPPVFPKWLKWLGRVVWSLQCSFQGARLVAVLSLSSSLVSMAHHIQFLAGFRYTCVSHLMPFCAAQLSSPFCFSSCCQVYKYFPGISCRSPWPSHSGVYSWDFSFCINTWCIWVGLKYVKCVWKPENQWVVAEASGTHNWVWDATVHSHTCAPLHLCDLEVCKMGASTNSLCKCAIVLCLTNTWTMFWWHCC